MKMEMTSQFRKLLWTILLLANFSTIWAQFVLTVDLITYDTNWNERFPCPEGNVCTAGYQYCLRPFGSTGGTSCSLQEFPTEVPSEMADNFNFNHTETFLLSAAGPVQFYLEAVLNIDTFGRFVVERFPFDLNEQVFSNFTETSQTGLQNIPNPGPPGIITIGVGLHCEENLFGPNCDIHCTPRDDAGGHFTCDNQGNRVCLRGYCEVGNGCTQECNECADNPCLNGGDCVDLFADFSCTCEPGFMGRLCDSEATITTEQLISTEELMILTTKEAVASTNAAAEDSLMSFFLSNLVVSVAVGAVVLVLVLMLALCLLVIGIVRMRRKLRRAKAEKQVPSAVVMDVPIELVATTKTPFYDSQFMSEEKGNRASYMSMHSPQAYPKEEEEEEEEHVYEPIPDVQESVEITHAKQDAHAPSVHIHTPWH